MKRVNKILKIMAVAVMLPFMGCTTDEPVDSTNNSFEITDARYNFNFRETEEVVFIPVKTLIPETKWKIVEPDAAWCHVSKSYDNTKGLYLAVDNNDDVDVRKTSFKVGAEGGAEYEFTVRQLGYGPAILVNNQGVGQGGGEISIVVTTNIDIIMGNPKIDEEDDADWIEVTNGGQPLTRAFADATYTLTAYPNTYPYERKATVAFRAADPMYNTDDVTAICTITQTTGSVKAELTYPDKRIPNSYISAEADQAHAGNEIDNLLDGDRNTVYHSPWQPPYDDPTTEFPVVWDFHFGNSPEAINLSYFVLYSATSGNGRPGSFNIEYKLNGDSDYTLMSSDANPNPTAEEPLFDFEQQGGQQTCRFPSTLYDITDLRVIWYDGSGAIEGQVDGFISSQEIEFYEELSKTVNEFALRVFTDLSCSELREGVTRKEITDLYGVAPYLAQEVAMRFYNDTYSETEREFRIHDYEPYSNGETLYTTFRTRKYTQHDNPTGIFATAGQTLLVCVGDIPKGQSVYLALCNEMSDGYSAQYNGFNQRVQLASGFNQISVSRDGACFIINRADNLTSSSQPVKVHILPGSGRVDGYFDIARHTDADYVRMLNSTGWKYFVAKGQNMIFMMHTSTLRQYAPTGIISGLTAWDDILGWQFELMGIGEQTADGVWDRKIDQTHFNNHMVAISNTNPSSYMDASDYRINFNATTGIPKIISRELLLQAEDNTWGPAHEAGHVNQRAIMWKSNTESSNNLFSNYAIYKMGKYGSRGSKIEDLAASFINPDHKAWVLMGSSTHMNEDTEIHMRMQWQLWNYFHRCGVDDQFWPRLFELCRTKYILPNGEPSGTVDCGKCQMMFAEAVCEAAQMDFTDFFEVWGFWEPVDITYEQYGAALYQVTQSMIDQTKKNIADKNYPQAPAMQYIEDRDIKDGTQYAELGYYTTFRDKKTISGTPTYTLEGRKISVSGASNAVAIELRKAGSGNNLGELVFFANTSGFEVPASVTASLSSLKVYAVQWDSKRVEAQSK